MAMSAAATAYSDSSRPVSSRRKFFNIFFCSPSSEIGWEGCLRLDGALQLRDPVGNGGAERREGADDRDGDERRRDGVLGQFETGLVAHEFLQHLLCAPSSEGKGELRRL